MWRWRCWRRFCSPVPDRMPTPTACCRRSWCSTMNSASTRRFPPPARSSCPIRSSRASAPTAAPASRCHQPGAGWTITPAQRAGAVRRHRGTDPIFRTNDGSISPNLPMSPPSPRARSAYSMLLNKGVIRVGIGDPGERRVRRSSRSTIPTATPAPRAFAVPPAAADDEPRSSAPSCGTAARRSSAASTNCLIGTTTCFATLHFDLADQANDATLGPRAGGDAAHRGAARARSSTSRPRCHRADLRRRRRRLDVARRAGRPGIPATQPFYFGINDMLGGDYRTARDVHPAVFTLYDGWQRTAMRRGSEADDAASTARAAGRARRGAVQHQADHDHRRRRASTTSSASPTHRRHLHDLPRHAERRRPLGAAAARHRHRRRRRGARRTMPLYTLRNKTHRRRPSRPPTRAAR